MRVSEQKSHPAGEVLGNRMLLVCQSGGFEGLTVETHEVAKKNELVGPDGPPRCPVSAWEVQARTAFRRGTQVGGNRTDQGSAGTPGRQLLGALP